MGRRFTDEHHRWRADLLEVKLEIAAANGVGSVAACVWITRAIGNVDARERVREATKLRHVVIFTGSAIAFLLLVCVIVPLLAVQSARRLGDRPLAVTREQLFANVIATQVFLFAIAWFTAREGGIRLWRSPRHLAWPAAAVILGAALLMLRLRWPSRTRESKARLYGMLPRDARERLPYAGVCIAAGIAEEIVYRGVLVALLASFTHNVIIAAVIAAVVFGVSHSIQGRRAVVAIVAIGLVLQALVAIADSLVPAMLVHALYDFAAGVLIPRWYERDLASDEPPASCRRTGRLADGGPP